jgi:hypothetical protein
MSIKFYCNNKECKKSYFYDVPDQIMIDDNNTAVLFCPFGADSLMKSNIPPDSDKNKLAGRGN